MLWGLLLSIKMMRGETDKLEFIGLTSLHHAEPRHLSILHPWRHFRVNRPGDKPEILQTFQRLGKHFPGNVRHVFLEIPKTAHTVFLHSDHGQNRPFVSYLGEDIPYGTKTFKICHKLSV